MGAVFAWAAWTAKRAHVLYGELKTGGRGWTHPVFQADAELGLAPIPGAGGGDMLPLGPPVPMRFDAEGFRAPIVETPAADAGPTLLALGDSFTYGAACLAEEAFPYRVGRALDGVARNAGAPSYGLSQVLILARRLIPRHRPDYVLVQHSEWLVARAQAGFAPTFFGVVPTPFFVPDGAGARLHPPVFRTRLFDFPLAGFRGTPRSLGDEVRFLAGVGFPLLAHDDVALAWIEARRRAGLLPDRAAGVEPIVRGVYAEIAALCRAWGARMLIVLLGPPPGAPVLEELARHATLVDAELALCRAVDTECPYTFPRVSRAYQLAYGHFRGTPPVFVDPHPNPRAHAVIAAEIIAAIRRGSR